jgi:two-component system, chemotaxis family, chemotaxis protein CheY
MSRIFVIDDDRQVRELVCRTLEAAGYEVTAFTDGAAGMTAIAEDAPDLVITDVFMPGQDGIVTLIHLRKAFPHLRVIVMSGGDSTGSIDLLPDAELLGASATLAKPFHKHQLVDVVQQVLAR